MNLYTNEVQPQFRAKFIPKVRLNSERWEKIAEKFEHKTRNHPNYKLYMTDGAERCACAVTENGKTKHYYRPHYFFSTDKKELVRGAESTSEWFASDVIGDMLAGYTDSEIASKLVKIFKQCKKAEEYHKKIASLEKTCKSEAEIGSKFDKLELQYFKSRKKHYESDSVLEKVADYYDGIIL